MAALNGLHQVAHDGEKRGVGLLLAVGRGQLGRGPGQGQAGPQGDREVAAILLPLAMQLQVVGNEPRMVSWDEYNAR